MASYELLIKRSAAKELEAVATKKDRQRLIARIRTLARESRPAGCEKLSVKERFRVRRGAYRIVYEIDDSAGAVPIVKIGHRKDVYR